MKTAAQDQACLDRLARLPENLADAEGFPDASSSVTVWVPSAPPILNRNGCEARVRMYSLPLASTTTKVPASPPWTTTSSRGFQGFPVLGSRRSCVAEAKT